MTKKYDKEYKFETVRLIQKKGKTVAQVAWEIGIPVKTLYRWVSGCKSKGWSYLASVEDLCTRKIVGFLWINE